MNIKRFEAPNISLALQQVKACLGEDAVILSTRRRQKTDTASGDLRRVVEIVAAVDFELVPSGRGDTKTPQRTRSARHNEATTTTPCNTDHGRHRNLVQEVQVLKGMLTRILGTLDQAQALYSSPGISLRGTYDLLPIYGEETPLLALHHILTELGVEPTTQHDIAARFLGQLGTDGAVTPAVVLRWLEAYGVSHIRTSPSAEESDTPCWWALVGPTGVGKTTTLAKLAAQLFFKAGRRGLLVTTDTYRLGGVDQLQRYAELMDVPLEITSDAAGLAKVFRRHRDKDFILVDTIGRSPRDPRHGRELVRLFEAVPGLKAQILLCATAKGEDLRDAICCYEGLPVGGWILSKVDETRAYGPLFTPVLGLRLPISYLTTGQQVPEDLQPASRQILARLFFPRRAESPDPEKNEPELKHSRLRKAKGLGHCQSIIQESA